MRFSRVFVCAASLAALLLWCVCIALAQSQKQPPTPHHPWDDKSLSPDQRADMVIKEMTLDEKIQLVHGTGWGALREGDPIPPRSNLGASYVLGIDRLGIPDINMADSAVGVRLAAMQSRYATLLPSTLGASSSWDPKGAQLYGSVIGRELRAQGYNMSIGGGVDITREPRNGRNFEYAGEDPVLAGTMTGNLMKGLQAQQVMGDIKHYAFNDQETGRDIINAKINHKAARESDLLAFEIAIAIAEPSGVMCAYNHVNGDYSCENDWLLNHVLKKDFGFKGWVLSDWGGTHSTVKAALAGLDQEMPEDIYFGQALEDAVQKGQVPLSRIEDMDHRILRSMFAAGVIDNPPMPRSVVDPFKGRDDAQQIEEESIVLLKNANNVLPLKSPESIAIIGSHADVGVLSGGGSAQVDPPGGNAANPHTGGANWGETVYFPSSPMKYIQKHAPNAKVEFNAGTDNASAAALAKASDVAIVFVNQPMYESHDARTLSLPDNQDALVSAVAAANPHTIVVLETGGPVTMPWADQVEGILAAWYPGIGGGEAIANLLFGDVNPSAKLPVTFAKSDDQLAFPEVPGIDLKPVEVEVPTVRRGQRIMQKEKRLPPFDVDYNVQGARVGYKWFESKNIQPLFPFGFGLSYTSYEYSGLKVDPRGHEVSFDVKNAGSHAGTEIAEVYTALPASAGENYKRLVAFDRVALAPGESKTVTLKIDPKYVSVFDEQKDGWQLLSGDYKVLVGPSSAETPLTGSFRIK
ncbi:MAG: glycoside hydrolase family 3 C-terminal domain-containing protein [Silvibacterium sp.]|nr:glycoside hydrolase family 3 C-terminal domain-containing protein [Silvibacterium sp.]MBV8438548.1 glycoside hydrolase family 3 C-terminal domain-containing protein [Silvibacterium sp.]